MLRGAAKTQPGFLYAGFLEVETVCNNEAARTVLAFRNAYVLQNRTYDRTALSTLLDGSPPPSEVRMIKQYILYVVPTTFFHNHI